MHKLCLPSPARQKAKKRESDTTCKPRLPTYQPARIGSFPGLLGLLINGITKAWKDLHAYQPIKFPIHAIRNLQGENSSDMTTTPASLILGHSPTVPKADVNLEIVHQSHKPDNACAAAPTQTVQAAVLNFASVSPGHRHRLAATAAAYVCTSPFPSQQTNHSLQPSQLPMLSVLVAPGKRQLSSVMYTTPSQALTRLSHSLHSTTAIPLHVPCPGTPSKEIGTSVQSWSWSWIPTNRLPA